MKGTSAIPGDPSQSSPAWANTKCSPTPAFLLSAAEAQGTAHGVRPILPPTAHEEDGKP